MLKLSLFALKAFTAFWSLVTFAVAGAMIAKFNDYARGYYVGGSGFSSGNAVVAAGVLTFIYLLVSLALFMLRNRSIVASIMVETIFLGFLWILLLGSVAALSADSPAFSSCYRNSFCALGKATIALGWILWLLVSIILFTQVYYTYCHFGGSLDTWRTPVYDLLDHNGPSDRGITATGGLGGGATTFPAASSGTATGAVPMTQTHQHQQPMQSGVAPQPKVETSAV